MRYVDSHAHIMSEEFQEDFEDVIAHIEEKQIEKVMIVCTRAEEALRAIDFAKANPIRYQVAYGIHPEDIKSVTKEDLEVLEEIVSKKEISAVGEIGLDYHWEPDTKEQQKELFIQQIKIANKVNKPILVHSRDAIQDTFDIMKEHRCRGLLHCFPGSAEMGLEFTKLGYYIALGGAITFKNARHSKEVCATIDPKYLLSETDCPYMAPEPHRGTRNEPSNIPFIVKVMAEVRNVTVEEMSEQIYRNYEHFLENKE